MVAVGREAPKYGSLDHGLSQSANHFPRILCPISWPHLVCLVPLHPFHILLFLLLLPPLVFLESLEEVQEVQEGCGTAVLLDVSVVIVVVVTLNIFALTSNCPVRQLPCPLFFAMALSLPLLPFFSCDWSFYSSCHHLSWRDSPGQQLCAS